MKAALDHVIQVCLDESDLEFVWVGDDGVDPLQRAQTLNILVGAGIKTIAEARAELGLAAEAKAAPGLGKYNHNHDERGRFASADNPGGSGAEQAKPPKGVEVAANDDAKAKSDAGGAMTVAQESTEEEPKPESEENYEGGTYFDPVSRRIIELPRGPIGPGRGWINLRDLPPGPTFLSAPESHKPPGTVAEAVAPNGSLPGENEGGPGSPRTMPASDDPDLAALEYIASIYNGQRPLSLNTSSNLPPGSFVATMPDGSFITFRPAGQASSRTLDSTASVDVNTAAINALNGGSPLKLKFAHK